MPNRTIYIRTADVEKWDALQDKSAVISELLNSLDEVSDVPSKNFDLVAPPREIPSQLEVQSNQIKVSPQGLLRHIKELEAEINDADITNQDPDYWAVIQEKQAKVKDLWAEWHQVTGR